MAKRLANGNGVSLADMQAEIDRLKAELAAKNAPKVLTCKVSEKGAVSVYGLGRWPVTLYRKQMENLLDSADMIRDFINKNADKLAVKV